MVVALILWRQYLYHCYRTWNIASIRITMVRRISSPHWILCGYHTDTVTIAYVPSPHYIVYRHGLCTAQKMNAAWTLICIDDAQQTLTHRVLRQGNCIYQSMSIAATNPCWLPGTRGHSSVFLPSVPTSFRKDLARGILRCLFTNRFQTLIDFWWMYLRKR